MQALKEEKREPILIQYLDTLETCNWNELANLYIPSALIESNLLPQIIGLNEYQNFWSLFIDTQNKIYIRIVENRTHEHYLRFLLITYSSIFHKMVYLDIQTTILLSEGKIIRQYDKVQELTFLAHLLTPLEFLLCLVPWYKNKIKRRFYTMLESTLNKTISPITS